MLKYYKICLFTLNCFYFVTIQNLARPACTLISSRSSSRALLCLSVFSLQSRTMLSLNGVPSFFILFYTCGLETFFPNFENFFSFYLGAFFIEFLDRMASGGTILSFSFFISLKGLFKNSLHIQFQSLSLNNVSINS